MNKVKMPVIDLEKRRSSFDEVNLGYSKEEAIKEASRCLNCKNPNCQKGCPLNIEIPKFIEAVKNDDVELANKIINKSSMFSSICGRVCPQEKQCEAKCVKGMTGESIAIGYLERYVADNAKNNFEKINEKKDEKICIVGSGPSALACASELIKCGYNVDVMESTHKLGGVLTYGIPEFRLPNDIVEKLIKELKNHGVNFQTDVVVGKTVEINELIKCYDAVYIATGAGLPKFLNIPNENANGVFSANEILTRINLMKAVSENYKTPIKIPNEAIVIGGGNVAMDVARSLIRLGAKVSVLYRKKIEDMKARKEEITHAIEEGVNIYEEIVPKSIEVDEENSVKSIIVSNNGNLEKIKCDMIVIAIGNDVNTLATLNSSILRDSNNLIITDENQKTNLDKVYAGGDATTGSSTVILALEAGIKAAREIINTFNVNKN